MPTRKTGLAAPLIKSMRTSKKIIAVIPARSGSKRLKNKNILPLAGKPMMAYTIEAALASGIFDDVLVSTDSEPMAKIARRYGASVPFLRNPQWADDHTPVSVATARALQQMQEHSSKEYGTVVQLMPNCPCRTADDIRRAYAQFRATGTKFQISVFPFGWMNPWWALKLDERTKRPRPLFAAALKKRSQDLKKLYCPTGAVWIADAASLTKAQTFYGKNYSAFVMDWQNAVDIDDEHDFKMAQVVLASRRSGKRSV